LVRRGGPKGRGGCLVAAVRQSSFVLIILPITTPSSPPKIGGELKTKNKNKKQKQKTKTKKTAPLRGEGQGAGEIYFTCAPISYLL